jgi:phospholipid transport system substrate-binding protein
MRYLVLLAGIAASHERRILGGLACTALGGMFRMLMNGYRALTRVLIFATALVLSAELQAGTAEAKSVVEKLHTTLLDVMKRADALGYSGRYDTLAPVISDSFDFDNIGQKLLGRYWAGLNADERKLFLETFKQLTTATYAARFDGFKGETFRTVSQETKGDWTIVTAKLVKSDGDTVQFKYILKSDGERWRILNVFADGVSELAARKAEYSGVMKDRGFDALIARLRNKIDHYAKEA